MGEWVNGWMGGGQVGGAAGGAGRGGAGRGGEQVGDSVGQVHGLSSACMIAGPCGLDKGESGEVREVAHGVGF